MNNNLKMFQNELNISFMQFEVNIAKLVKLNKEYQEMNVPDKIQVLLEYLYEYLSSVKGICKEYNQEKYDSTWPYTKAKNLILSHVQGLIYDEA